MPKEQEIHEIIGESLCRGSDFASLDYVVCLGAIPRRLMFDYGFLFR
jgi:hypothetical protein